MFKDLFGNPFLMKFSNKGRSSSFQGASACIKRDGFSLLSLIFLVACEVKENCHPYFACSDFWMKISICDCEQQNVIWKTNVMCPIRTYSTHSSSSRQSMDSTSSSNVLVSRTLCSCWVLWDHCEREYRSKKLMISLCIGGRP